MIQELSRCRVADNSGAREVMVFRLMTPNGKGATGKRYAVIGDIVVVSVKDAIPNAGVKKKEIYKALVVRTRKEFRRADGSYIRFGENTVVLLKKMDSAKAEAEPVGSRIFGPIPREIRERHPKVISLAPEVI